MKGKIVYNPNLSVKDNAANNGVSIAAIRKFIKENGIDRKGDEAIIKTRMVKKLKKAHPQISVSEIANQLGWAWNTAKKYYSMDETSISDTEKVSTFDLSKKKFIIKSVSDNQSEILSNILRLYVESYHFDCDLTYSIGVFYKRIPQPKMKFDKYPQCEDVRPLDDAFNLPENSLHSIVIDLPFVIRGENDTHGSMIEDRFNAYRSYEELKQSNADMIQLAYDKLCMGGLLIMKTMNICFKGKQLWVANYVVNTALSLGFEMVDEFILISKSKILTTINKQQYHARKYHSFFFVFKKTH